MGTVRSRANLVSTTQGVITTNGSGNITGAVLDSLLEDFVASCGNISDDGQVVIISIGDWNMDTTITVNVNHGLADVSKIRSVRCIIRDDTPTNYYDLTSNTVDGFGAVQSAGGIGAIGATTIQLRRVTGGVFDSATFDATSYNRGWVTFIVTQ